MERNILWVVQGHDHPWLQYHVHWWQTMPVGCPGVAPPAGVLAAKTRYRQSDAACRLSVDQRPGTAFSLDFAEPQWAVTPGQSAVVYDGEVCLGGGVILSAVQNGMSSSMSSKPLDGRDRCGCRCAWCCGRGREAGALGRA